MENSAPLETACKQYEEDLVLHYYGENSDEEKRGIEEHLAACHSCRRFLDDLRRLLPQMADAAEMPQTFWDSYYRETVSKLAEQEERKYWWRSLFTPMRTWMVPAFATAAVAVLVVGLLFGKGNLRLFVEPRPERIPQEILADQKQLEFFESMDMLEALGKLENQDDQKTDALNSEFSRAGLLVDSLSSA
ncbi:MAG: anti-sigma factor family protein [Candidatus Binatia bacterium]